MDKCFAIGEWEQRKKNAGVTLVTDDDNQTSAHKNLAASNNKCHQSVNHKNVGTHANDDGQQLLAPKNVVDLVWKRSSDWKPNKRVKILEVNDDEREIRNNFVKHELLRVAKDFMQENCDKSGKVTNSNISEKQEKGLEEIRKQFEDGVVIYETDKTSKFAMDTLSNARAN